MNQKYLEAIRNNSCYPTFRGFVGFFTLIGYLIAAVIAIGSIFSGQIGAILIGCAVATITALLFRVAKEMSLMLADIADATIDASRTNSARQPIAHQDTDSPWHKP